MARRRRSYRANSDKLLSTAFNNYLVAREKQKKAESRERAASSREQERAAKRRAREQKAERKKTEQEQAKRAKAEERARTMRIRAEEREAARAAKKAESHQKKIEAITSRLYIELGNKNFLLIDSILEEIAEGCVKASIAPAKAYKMYVSPREKEFRSKMIDTFIEYECKLEHKCMIPESAINLYSDLQYKQQKLKDVLLSLSNSDEIYHDLKAKATELNEYLECLAVAGKLKGIIESEIKRQEQIEAAMRAEDSRKKKSRDDFIERFSLECFEDDLDYVRRIAESENFDEEQIRSLEDYIEAKVRKSSYVKEIKGRLGAFMDSSPRTVDARGDLTQKGLLVPQHNPLNADSKESADKKPSVTNKVLISATAEAKQTNNEELAILSLELSTGLRKFTSLMCYVVSLIWITIALAIVVGLIVDHINGATDFIALVFTTTFLMLPTIILFWVSRKLKYTKKTLNA